MYTRCGFSKYFLRKAMIVFRKFFSLSILVPSVNYCSIHVTVISFFQMDDCDALTRWVTMDRGLVVKVHLLN